jgi:RNA polymerase sigma-70 factor (ECF subfamily)
MPTPDADSQETLALLEQADSGDTAACDRLLERHQRGLRAFVELRLDPQLRTRLNASDVVQEANLEAIRRLPDFLRRRPMPFRLWLRKTAHERLLMLRRRHLGAKRRAVRREVQFPNALSQALAKLLLARGSSPSDHLDRKDLAQRVQQALAGLTETDRELLLMRNYEGLEYEEIACILGIELAAVRKRHGRALLRLHAALKNLGEDVP